MNGTELIAAERRRQMEKEGWTPEHDATHTGGELAKTAICYAASAIGIEVKKYEIVPAGRDDCAEDISDLWPWDCCHDKRKTHPKLKQLVISGALIAAEIDRLLASGEVKFENPKPEDMHGEATLEMHGIKYT